MAPDFELLQNVPKNLKFGKLSIMTKFNPLAPELFSIPQSLSLFQEIMSNKMHFGIRF